MKTSERPILVKLVTEQQKLAHSKFRSLRLTPTLSIKNAIAISLFSIPNSSKIFRLE